MPKIERTDLELIHLFRSGSDRDALGTLFLRYMDLVYGVCLKYTGQPESARDAVMDIYEHVHKKLPDHEVQNFGAWLYMVSKNHCLQIIRRKSNLLTVSLDDPAMQNGQELHQEDDFDLFEGGKDVMDQLHDCISRLPDQQAYCIRKFYFERIAYADISESAGMTLDQVRSHIQNGRRNLKNCMQTKQKLGSGKDI